MKKFLASLFLLTIAISITTGCSIFENNAEKRHDRPSIKWLDASIQDVDPKSIWTGDLDAKFTRTFEDVNLGRFRERPIWGMLITKAISDSAYLVWSTQKVISYHSTYQPNEPDSFKTIGGMLTQTGNWWKGHPGVLLRSPRQSNTTASQDTFYLHVYPGMLKSYGKFNRLTKAKLLLHTLPQTDDHKRLVIGVCLAFIFLMLLIYGLTIKSISAIRSADHKYLNLALFGICFLILFSQHEGHFSYWKQMVPFYKIFSGQLLLLGILGWVNRFSRRFLHMKKNKRWLNDISFRGIVGFALLILIAIIIVLVYHYKKWDYLFLLDYYYPIFFGYAILILGLILLMGIVAYIQREKTGLIFLVSFIPMWCGALINFIVSSNLDQTGFTNQLPEYGFIFLVVCLSWFLIYQQTKQHRKNLMIIHELKEELANSMLGKEHMPEFTSIESRFEAAVNSILRKKPRSIRVNDVAKVLGMSKSTLCEKIKNPSKKIKEIQLRESQRLLRENPELDMGRISELVCMELVTFRSNFKKFFHMTPSEFKNGARN